MASDAFEVTPPGLWDASGIIATHAALVPSAMGSLTGSSEMSGAAASAVHAAFDGYCVAFSQRLSSVSTALVRVANSFTATESANTRTVESVLLTGDAPADGV